MYSTTCLHVEESKFLKSMVPNLKDHLAAEQSHKVCPFIFQHWNSSMYPLALIQRHC